MYAELLAKMLANIRTPPSAIASQYASDIKTKQLSFVTGAHAPDPYHAVVRSGRFTSKSNRSDRLDVSACTSPVSPRNRSAHCEQGLRGLGLSRTFQRVFDSSGHAVWVDIEEGCAAALNLRLLDNDQAEIRSVPIANLRLDLWRLACDARPWRRRLAR